MAERESRQTTTEFQGKPAPCGAANGSGASLTHQAPTPGDSDDDDHPVRGISVLSVPRREIARLQGTLRLSALPRHQPTIVFAAGRQSREPDDE